MVVVTQMKLIMEYIRFAPGLEWAKLSGNDLITPHPEFGFPGLKNGDCWCVCAGTYSEAIKAGIACKIFLKKTNYKTLEIIPLEKLKEFAIDLS